jgi:hypothetical protein
LPRKKRAPFLVFDHLLGSSNHIFKVQNDFFSIKFKIDGVQSMSYIGNLEHLPDWNETTDEGDYKSYLRIALALRPLNRALTQ